MAKPLFPIPDRQGNYTPEQLRECKRVRAVLDRERADERACRRQLRMRAAAMICMLAAIGSAICFAVAMTGCEPVQVQHKADVHHHIPEKIDINIRFPDRKPRNAR